MVPIAVERRIRLASWIGRRYTAPMIEPQSSARRRAFLARAAAIATAALSGMTPRFAIAQERPVIKVGGTPNDDMSAVVYGVKSGMFEHAGLDVQLQKTMNGSAAAAAVAGGAYDLAKSSIMAIFSAHEKGIPFTVVAPASIYDSRAPYGGWLLPKDSPIKTGKDCAGLTMAVAGLGDIGYVAMEAWIAQNGGDPKATNFVEVPFTALGAAIEQRRVSGGETAPPSTADAMATGNFRFLPVYTAIAKRFCGAVFYTTKDFSTKHPQELKTFVRVLYDAARYANAHPDESAGPIAEFSGISVDVIKHFVRAQLGTELVAAQIQPTIDAAAQNGVISRSFPATEVIDANVPSRR
jgi:NitT/TauT family transport system substrate-binding protein